MIGKIYLYLNMSSKETAEHSETLKKMLERYIKGYTKHFVISDKTKFNDAMKDLGSYDSIIVIEVNKLIYKLDKTKAGILFENHDNRYDYMVNGIENKIGILKRDIIYTRLKSTYIGFRNVKYAQLLKSIVKNIIEEKDIKPDNHKEIRYRIYDNTHTTKYVEVTNFELAKDIANSKLHAIVYDENDSIVYRTGI